MGPRAPVPRLLRRRLAVGPRVLTDFGSPVAQATRERLARRFGSQVGPWWDALPGAVDRLAARWTLTPGEPVGRGNTSLVLRCRRADGRPAMLKLCPDAAISAAEAVVLRTWAASGRVPEVWAAAAGTLLLEAIGDGSTLSDRGGPVGMEAVAALIVALHEPGAAAASTRPGGHRFPSLAEGVEFAYARWIDRRGREPAIARRVTAEALERGAALARELAAEAAPAVLLHGDLHPANVLDAGPARGLVAIDPRACIGDPAFEAIDWVFWGEPDPAAWAPRARALAALTGDDPDRVWRWCRAFAPQLAASRAGRGAPEAEIAALLDVGR